MLLTIIGFFGLFIFIALTGDTSRSPTTSRPAEVELKQLDIEVNFLNVKRLVEIEDGELVEKWRYFFQFKNNDSAEFDGDITVKLLRASGDRTWQYTWTGPMVPGNRFATYTDAHTGPTDKYGDYKITSFSFEAKSKTGRASGSGKITP
jgi:hypothetical protein